MQAVLLDRDGVINRERANYVRNWHEFEFLPTALSALARLAMLPQPILVVSNQSAIGRGLVTRATVDDIHCQLKEQAEACGGRIDRFYLCPHHPDEGCICRKPKPGLLLQAAQDFSLDLSQCVFIGDSITDYQAAKAVGCRCILVRTGRQGSMLHLMLSDKSQPPIVPNLNAAVSMILAQVVPVEKGRYSDNGRS
jgi:D-glycero-D-manno-heptose 1,7-bisphosphate phosphatase